MEVEAACDGAAKPQDSTVETKQDICLFIQYQFNI